MPDPFLEGVDADATGTPRAKCPHPLSSDERDAWLKGWDESAGARDDIDAGDDV